VLKELELNPSEPQEKVDLKLPFYSKFGSSSRTPHEHIRKHNRTVELSGFCPKCRRANGAFEVAIILKSQLTN